MIVAVIPDRFKAGFESEVAFRELASPGVVQGDVRRPTRGIQLKEDTYATMRVILGNGTALPLVNAGSRNGTMIGDKLHSKDYSNFLIQAVNEERAEKSQIVETFGEAFIFFFGERPRMLSIQGVLLNTFDFNWEAEWWFNYDNYLRGTKCVEKDARVFLSYDDVMVSGYIMAAQAGKNAQERNHIPLNIQFFVTDYINISALGDPNAEQGGRKPINSLSALDYRPMLLPTQGMQSTLSPTGDLSLIQALTTSAVRTVQDSWQKANILARNVISSVDSMLGNPIRVPLGFEGSLVFDDPQVKLSDLAGSGLAGLGTVVRYSTFGQNADEFVGGASPYASSDIALGGAMDGTFSGIYEFANAYELVERARTEWAAVGLFPPDPMVAKIMNRAAETGVGMQVVGAAKTALRGTTIATGVLSETLAPVVAGTTAALGDLALADTAASAAGVDTNALADRAITAAGTSSFDILNGLKSVQI
jgi:hypothetical protein